MKMRATSVWRRVWYQDDDDGARGEAKTEQARSTGVKIRRRLRLSSPRLASPPSLASPSLMPTLDLFCLPVLHLWTSIIWLFEEKGKCSPCLPSRPRCSPFLFCPQQVMIQAFCFHSQLNLLILNKPKLISTARNLKDWQFRLRGGGYIWWL